MCRWRQRWRVKLARGRAREPVARAEIAEKAALAVPNVVPERAPVLVTHTLPRGPKTGPLSEPRRNQNDCVRERLRM